MKKNVIIIVLIMSTLSGFSQNSVLISPTGTETVKFSSTVGEKITFFDNGTTSKHGIGLTNTFTQSMMNFYTPTSADDFVFGVGANSTMTERFRIKGNGNVGIGVSNPDYPLVTRGRIRIRDSGGGESAGVWFNSNGNTALNTFIGIDPANNFGIYSPLLVSNVVTVRMSNGNVGIGNTSPNAPLQFSNGLGNRKIVLYENSNNDHQYYGFGVNSGVFRYQTDATFADHVFYAAVNSTTSNELFRIKGTGNVVVAGRIENEVEQTPTFAGSWTNYGAGYQGAKFYKDKENRVHLSGGVSNLNNVSASIIFTLPAGYRPSEHLTFHVDAINGTSARIIVFSSGDVTYYSFNSNSNGENQFVSLSGISFRVN